MIYSVNGTVDLIEAPGMASQIAPVATKKKFIAKPVQVRSRALP